MPAPSRPELRARGQFATALPALVVPRAGRAGPTPRLSMQVSLLVGHSQPGPSQPLSHTQAPLEQRPRSVTRVEELPRLCLSLTAGCRGAANSPQGKHPPHTSASAESLHSTVPCQCHQPRDTLPVPPGQIDPTAPGGCWGQRGCSHRCRGSQRCVGTAGRRTGRTPRRSAASGPRSSTGTSHTSTRPGPSTAPRPQGGCRLRCWVMMPGSSHTCPLAWWEGDGAERQEQSEGQQGPGQGAKGTSVCHCGPPDPAGALGAGHSPYQPGWQMHCPQTKSPWKLHLRELNSCCCRSREKRRCQLGSAAPKTVSRIRKAGQGAEFCP